MSISDTTAVDSWNITPWENEPPPEDGEVPVGEQVVRDIEARIAMGKKKYGTLLKTRNGRNALKDTYEELIDALMYVRQRMLEDESTLTFDEYQKKAVSTAVYPQQNWAYYLGLGLAGEAGETANKIKKAMRNDNGVITDERRSAIIEELGDVLWYVANLCEKLEITMEDVARQNNEKLQRRMSGGILKHE